MTSPKPRAPHEAAMFEMVRKRMEGATNPNDPQLPRQEAKAMSDIARFDGTPYQLGYRQGREDAQHEMATGETMNKARREVAALQSVIVELGYYVDMSGAEPAWRCMACNSGAVVGEPIPHQEGCPRTNTAETRSVQPCTFPDCECARDARSAPKCGSQ